MLESTFKTRLTKKLRKMFPGCYILKNDASYLQGVPDMLILFGPRWAALETKQAFGARRQPNQDYHVRKMNAMSYSAFISPENEEEILYELQLALGPGG